MKNQTKALLKNGSNKWSQPEVISDDDKKATLADFELGIIHNIKKDKVRFSKEMTPAIALCCPKYAHNVGAAVRAASCFGARMVLFTGDRIIPERTKKGYRLPREERMRGYNDILMINDDYFINRFPPEVTPVAVEMRPNAEDLTEFEHPEYPLYIFGPEDGSIGQTILSLSHRFVVIPSKHCLNLAAAVNVLLYDRVAKS